MAEEGIDTPATPEKHVLEKNANDLHPRRASVGAHLITDVHYRRASVGPRRKSDYVQNMSPHVLRASTGSCHDACKYGTKHAFEEKPWKKPMRKGTTTNNFDFVHIKVTGEQKKEKVANTSLEPKTCAPRSLKNNPSHVKKTPSPEPPEVIKKVVITSPSQKVDVSEKHGSLGGGKMSKTMQKTDHHSGKRSAVESMSTKVKLLPSSDSSGVKHGNGIRNTNFRTERKIMAVPRASGKTPLAPTVSTPSPKLLLTRTVSFDGKKAGSLKLVPLLKDRSKTRMAGAKMPKNEKVLEKTLHVIKVEPGSSTKSSFHKKGAEVKENYKKTLRNRVVFPEDKYRSPVKLQFRSGKVVELRLDTNTPRRLKFRRARAAAAEDGKGEFTKKTFSKATADADVAGAELSQKVVLKHQDVQGKKEARVLFNNVIEETASKLVESRKSKVKALVGAFETVISLQEVKSSSQTVKSSDE